MLSKPNKWLNPKKTHLKRLYEPDNNASKRLLVKQKTIRVLIDAGSNGDLLFIKKGSQKYIPTMKRVVPRSWGTSNGTFQTKRVGAIDISFMEYSASKLVKLNPDIVEYKKRSSSTFLRPNHRQANLARYRCGPGL